jgi:hypothetical protein
MGRELKGSNDYVIKDIPAFASRDWEKVSWE